MKVIHLCGAEWAFMLSLYNLQPDMPAKGVTTEQGDHVFPIDGRPDRLVAGIATPYGWRFDDDADQHDYAVLSQGRARDGRHAYGSDIEISLFYPERLFVWGDDNEGHDLTHDELRECLKPILQRSSPGFWHPTRVHRGYHKGVPTFYRALRAHTDIGETWYGALTKLGGKLPENYQWTPYERHGELLVLNHEKAKA